MTEMRDLEPLRRPLYDYCVAYYTELRRLLHAQPSHKSDPEAFPYHLRDHPRVISAAECADGYGVIHSTAPKVGIMPSKWMTYVCRDKRTNRYLPMKERQERIEAISCCRVATLTADKARNNARSVLRAFFEGRLD